MGKTDNGEVSDESGSKVAGSYDFQKGQKYYTMVIYVRNSL